MPRVQSLLDLDFYKFTMGQVAFNRYRDVPVTYAFINRTKSVALPEFINESELRAELERVQSLRFRPEELAYLRESEYVQRGLFSDPFLSSLAELRLPNFQLAVDGRELRIEVTGPWAAAIYWETLILCVVSELYSSSLIAKQGITISEAWAEGDRRVGAKIAALNGNRRVRFSDFGTRRRFSFEWQRHIIATLARQLPEQLAGTSNVLLAREFALRPIGTYAHEMDMVLSGVYHNSDEEVRASHNKVLQLWWEQYGEEFAIGLTDTYGTEFFLHDMTPEQVRVWRGVRHDSGDPFAFGEKIVRFYESRGIDPRTKTIVFSDGLDVEKILALVERFEGRIQVAFGWGTNLTNDLGFDPPSMIVKPIRAAGRPVVKLGDNFDKATGERGEIERFKVIFGHTQIPSLGIRY